MQIRKANNRGVSITELAISIAIIGILIAGVLGGQNMIKAAQIRAVANEFVVYKQAVQQFEESYGYLPGDFPNAYQFWGAACGTNDSGMAGSCNGNGDGDIDLGHYTATTPPQEDLLAWEHLTKSEIIPGTFTGTHSSTYRYVLDKNCPTSDGFEDACYRFDTNKVYNIFNTGGHYTILAAINSSGGHLNGALTAKDAKALEDKIDDGLPSSGELYIIRGSGVTGCVDAATTASSANFSLDTTDRDCRPIYWYKKF